MLVRYTSTSAGDSAQMLCAARTLLSIPASSVGNRNMTSPSRMPKIANVSHATRKILRACMGRPSVSASLIMRESATGMPAVAIVRKT